MSSLFIVKRLRSIVLTTLLTTSTIASALTGGRLGSVITHYVNDETYFSECFLPTTRFAVASDVHISGSGVEEARLARLFDTVYEYADHHSDYQEVDGIFFAGDCADRGDKNLINSFFEIANSKVRKGTVLRAVPGNHEFYNTQTTASDFMEAGNYSELNVDLTINGYHFIFIYPDNDGSGYSATTLLWLENRIHRAESQDPTGSKPIFVFQHQHPAGTVYGSDNWGLASLTAVLQNHPQVVDFSGHSHFPINDPRSIWQGSFTALGDGTLSYYEMGIVDYKDDSIFATDREGGYGESYSGYRDAAQYYIVEVDDNNAICIKGYDLLSDTIIVEYHIRSVASPLLYTYTDTRANSSDTPVFASDARLEVEETSCRRATIRIPQADGGNTPVQNYRLELYQDQKLVQTAYCLSDYFYNPTPTSLRKTLTDLTANTEYTVLCYAVNCWGKVSASPLRCTFKTAEGHSVIEMDDFPVTPDIFSLKLYEDGCAYNAVSKKALSSAGAPPTVQKDDAEKLSLILNGKGVCYDADFSGKYQELSDGVTMELCGTLQFPETGYTDIFANMQQGGIGFELTSEGKIQFWISIDRNYHTLECDAPEGELLHCVGTYDGSEISLWLNGEKKASETAAGAVTFPEDQQAQKLYIGADSSSGGYERPCCGSVRTANIYKGGLTEAQIQDLFEHACPEP